ncbi:lipopolysaccharide biosynthesis protein [bacterium]|nr:MAG: lipopolysaccharide biosynthesis protein [bacterium]
MLYFRMLLTMFVSLFTVRIVLNTLGVVDYGIYNVVGGIVVMFSFLSGTMASASQRFFAFELGRNNIPQLKKTFSMTMTIYAMLAVIILILAETVGLWFLNTQMTIPDERMVAANWVYQFSIFSFMMTMFTIPYNASIIAHERMNVYAYVSIIEVVLKLAIVYLLVLFSYDKLKLYAVLMFVVITIVTFIYRTYCKRKFEECQYHFYWNKPLFKELISYSGWSLFGALSGIMRNQGINILLNIFFGPVVNAARAIAYQVNNAINQFATNFYTAVRPQIVKYYAAEEKEKMLKLVFQSSKLSFFLLFLLSMPILLETHFILALWLKQVPEYVMVFTVLVIITALIDSLSYPLMTAAQATGKIKQYQVVVGGTLILNLPISYCFLKLGFPPQITMYIAIVISVICLFLRLWMLRGLVGLSISDYWKKVLRVIISVSVVAYIIPLFLSLQLEESFIRLIIVGVVGVITSVATIYVLGLSINERQFIIQIIKNRIMKKINLKHTR